MTRRYVSIEESRGDAVAPDPNADPVTETVPPKHTNTSATKAASTTPPTGGASASKPEEGSA